MFFFSRKISIRNFSSSRYRNYLSFEIIPLHIGYPRRTTN